MRSRGATRNTYTSVSMCMRVCSGRIWSKGISISQSISHSILAVFARSRFGWPRSYARSAVRSARSQPPAHAKALGFSFRFCFGVSICVASFPRCLADFFFRPNVFAYTRTRGGFRVFVYHFSFFLLLRVGARISLAAVLAGPSLGCGPHPMRAQMR